MGIINTLIRSHDAHSLECLCVLLATIGPEIKKVILTIRSTPLDPIRCRVMLMDCVYRSLTMTRDPFTNSWRDTRSPGTRAIRRCPGERYSWSNTFWTCGSPVTRRFREFEAFPLDEKTPRVTAVDCRCCSRRVVSRIAPPALVFCGADETSRRSRRSLGRASPSTTWCLFSVILVTNSI